VIPATTPLRDGNGLDSPRPPPMNEDAEQALLSAILFTDGKAHSRVSGSLKPEHFSRAVHQRIFAAICAKVERGELANPVTLKAQFDQDPDLVTLGGSKYLFQLADNVRTVHNAEDYGRAILDAYQRRALITLAEDVREDAYACNLTRSADEIIASFETRLSTIARGSDTGTLQIKSGGDYRMRKIEWIWPGWLARGKLHLLGGQKGAGKSTISFDLLAQITVSGKLPDETRAPLGDVLIWSAEDDIEDTILPRIVAAGGDRTRVRFVDKIAIGGITRAFDPAIDMPALRAALQKFPELLAVMIDPIVSATAGDSHRNTETRRGLQPVVDLAIERNIALIGITHFTKNTQGQDPIERITGSLAYGAVPRVVWAAVKGDNEDRPRRLVRIGSNIGPSGGGFEYLLRQDPLLDHDFSAQRIIWGKRLDGSPLDLLETGQEKGKKLQAMELLDTMLVNGPVAMADIREAATANGISWSTVERAKADAKNINAEQAGTLRRRGLIQGENARGWYWLRQTQSVSP
jgi:putative DNA primase/helicase